MDKDKAQLDRFKEAARDISEDEDEARWDARLRKLPKIKQEKPE